MFASSAKFVGELCSDEPGGERKTQKTFCVYHDFDKTVVEVVFKVELIFSIFNERDGSYIIFQVFVSGCGRLREILKDVDYLRYIWNWE